MKFPLVSIIILNWNGLRDTLECLESVYKLDYPNFEVIVVDNGSTDGSVTVIREKYPQVILIENKENLGYAGGNNIAMQYAMKQDADYVWLLNNDIVVESDSLSKLLGTSESRPQIGLASPVVYYFNNPEMIQFCGSYVDFKNKTIVYPEDKNLHIDDDFIDGENVCLWAAALLIKKNIVEKIGYFEEKFFAYWEDTEYSVRALKSGYRNAVCTSAKVYHKTPKRQYPGAGIKRVPYYYYFMTRNMYYLGNKYFRSFLGHYLSFVLMLFKYCNEDINAEAANACLQGAWDAFHGISGGRPMNAKAPASMRRIFYLCSSWHPYFWANLLKGNFSHILSEIIKRTMRRYS